MNNFQKMQVKASAVAMNISMFLLGQPVRTPSNYEALTKSSYNRAVWVYSCVRAISEASAAIPLVLYKRHKNGDVEEITDHPLLNLLRNPNPMTTEFEYRQNVIAFLLLSGNSYEEIVYNLGRPLELYTWRPDRTQVVPDKEGIRALRYTVNGMEKDIDFKHAIHHKMFNALDDFYGLSPLEVARASVDMDNATQDWNTSVVQNSGMPSGVLVAPETRSLTQPEVSRLRRTLNRMFSGIKNVGKPQLLEGGLKWEQLGLAPKDMDFIESRKMTREEICSVFRTPPQIVGIQDKSTYTNYKEARQAFYIDAVLPTLDRVLAGWNHKLVPLFNEPGLFVGYDKDQIEALQESNESKYTRMKDAAWLSFNEKREATGYEAIEGGNVLFVQVGSAVVPMGPDAHLYADMLTAQTNSFNQQQNGAGNGDDEPPKKPPKKPRSDENEDEPEDEADEQKGLRELQLLFKQRQENKAFADKVNEQREQFGKKLEARVLSLLESDQQRAVKAIESFNTLSSSNKKAIDKAIDKSVSAGKDEWIEELTDALRDVCASFALSSRLDMLKQVKQRERGYEVKEDEWSAEDFELTDEEFEQLNEYIDEFVDEHVAEEVKWILATTALDLKNVIATGIENGESIGAIAKRIQQADNYLFSKNRAYVIARTEVLSAASYANRMGAKSVDVPMDKTWVAGGDSRTRPSHKKADGQTVGMDEYYRIGGHKCMYPGDTMLPAKERIQCRCAERYTVK